MRTQPGNPLGQKKPEVKSITTGNREKALNRFLQELFYSGSGVPWDFFPD